MAAIGRTNDAILYGGVVELVVRGDDELLKTSGQACRVARRPILAGRLPKSSPATSTISIASIRCFQPGRDYVLEPGYRHDATLRRNCAAVLAESFGGER